MSTAFGRGELFPLVVKKRGGGGIHTHMFRCVYHNFFRGLCIFMEILYNISDEKERYIKWRAHITSSECILLTHWHLFHPNVLL
jgi:hypothetical protein